MITNRRQLNVTRSQIRRLEAVLKASRSAADRMDRRVFEAMVAGIQSQIEDLQKELADFAEMEKAQAIDVGSAEDLPMALIQARIARGLTQGDLAAKLSVPAQQVQRYESTRYQGVGFRRILDVIRALGLGLSARVDLRPKATREHRGARARSADRRPPRRRDTETTRDAAPTSGAKTRERRDQEPGRA
ncbi:MAG: helix-turn-helix transcriptional regulator [Deltaproteobacteria bacterium]|nr:helix-turn-helix transcriptional regulator [Deltaproteobacteria bacterium]